jgi:hypothetical protein
MRLSPKNHTTPASYCPALPPYPRPEHIALRKSDRASIAARAIPIMHIAILMLALAILLHHLAKLDDAAAKYCTVDQSQPNFSDLNLFALETSNVAEQVEVDCEFCHLL